MRVLGIDHLVLRSARPERLVAFYCNVLGCTEERRVAGQAGLIQLRAGTALIDIAPLDPRPDDAVAAGRTEHNLDHFCLLVAPFDPDELRQRLAAAGVPAEPPARRYGAGGFGLSIYLRDPDGNGLELRGG